MSKRLTHDCSCKSSFINQNNSFNKLISERGKKLEQEQFLKEEGAEILQFLEQVFKIIDQSKLTNFAEENSNSSNIRSLPPPIDEESNLPEATTNSSLSSKKSSQINRSRPVSEKISDQESSSSEEDSQKKTGDQNNEDEPEVMKDDLDSLISSLGSFSGMPERRTRPQRAQPVKPEAVKLGMDMIIFFLTLRFGF